MKNEPFLNIGYQQRVAGRDYFEFSKSDSVSRLLLTEPKERLDSLAVENERMFHKRFGFYANSETRECFVGMVAKNDLTDHEVRCLNRAGFLDIKQNRVVPDTGLFLLLLTYFQFAVFAFLSIIFLLPALLSASGQISSYVYSLGLCLLSAGISYYIFKYIIMPGRTLRSKKCLF